MTDTVTEGTCPRSSQQPTSHRYMSASEVGLSSAMMESEAARRIRPERGRTIDTECSANTFWVSHFRGATDKRLPCLTVPTVTKRQGPHPLPLSITS